MKQADRQKLNQRIADWEGRVEKIWVEIARYQKIIHAAGSGIIPLSSVEQGILKMCITLVSSELMRRELALVATEDDYSNRSER